MRQDMDKVLMEGGRPSNRWRKRPKGYQKNLQYEQHIALDTPSRESMTKMKDGWACDYGSQWTIKPVLKFLKKNCGRPWSEVFSELSKALPADKKGHLYARVRDYALDLVEEHTQIIDGEIYDSKGYPISHWSGDAFYVDGSGLLQVVKEKEGWYKRHKKPKPQFKKTDDGEWLIFDRGRSNVWYACTMQEYDMGQEPYVSRCGKHTFYGVRSTFPFGPRDMFLNKSLYFDGHAIQGFYGAQVYCTKKRQIGKREIKRYGLRQAVSHAA